MNAFDFIFGNVKQKDIHKAVIENGYLKPETVVKMKDLVRSQEFQTLCRLLIVISDRKGRHDVRLEDAYAQFPVDLQDFLYNCTKKLEQE